MYRITHLMSKHIFLVLLSLQMILLKSAKNGCAIGRKGKAHNRQQKNGQEWRGPAMPRAAVKQVAKKNYTDRMIIESKEKKHQDCKCVVDITNTQKVCAQQPQKVKSKECTCSISRECPFISIIYFCLAIYSTNHQQYHLDPHFGTVNQSPVKKCSSTLKGSSQY